MKSFLCILFLSFCFISNSFTQVEVKEDFPIDMMMSRYAEANKSEQKINGWRIQLTASTDRQAVEKAREEFMTEFPGISVDWTHSKPYYRLKAGAFNSKLEAIRILQDVKEQYPGAFPVKDEINKEELLPRM